MGEEELGNNQHFFLLIHGRDNVVSLDVFFESLGYDEIEQKPVFDDWALLGNTILSFLHIDYPTNYVAMASLGAVGGTLGLFLGTSILTGLEFLDFLVICLIRALRRNKTPPKEEEELGEINHSLPIKPNVKQMF